MVLPLTADISPIKPYGAVVKAGESLVRLEMPHEGEVRVESVDIQDEIAEIRLQPKSVVKIDKAVTVRVGDKLDKGDPLTKGAVAPHTLLEAAGVQKARQYLLNEIHKVYKQQGVDINDKHLEVIIRQILNNVRIVDRGDSRFLLGDLVTLEEFGHEVKALAAWNQEADRMRKEAIGESLAEDVVEGGHIFAAAGDVVTAELISVATKAGAELIRIERNEEVFEIPLVEKRLPDGERELLRISKAALQTKGWLSAASFQRTTKVLAEAALRGETDTLDGLKPSIIVGKKIPSGTGFRGVSVAEPEDEEGQEVDGEDVVAAAQEPAETA
jgi:DNA-directed RNA polymerase subunit beta'